MKLITAITLLVLVGCKCGHTTSTKKEVAIIPAKQSTSPKASDLNKDRLLGIWTNSNSENATFDIRRDSIFYVDQLAAYSYLMKDDSIIIHYPDWTFSGKVSFSKDTLAIISEDGTAKFWKFTE